MEMIHQIFCLSPSGIGFLERVWLGAACILQVMEEIGFSSSHFEFLGERMSFLTFLLLLSHPPTKST